MDKAKRARTAETPKRPSLCLMLRAPYLYPDRAYSAFTTDSAYADECAMSAIFHEPRHRVPPPTHRRIITKEAEF